MRECCERVAFPEPVGAAWQQTCLGRPPLPIPQYPVVVAVCQSDLSLFAALRTSRARSVDRRRPSRLRWGHLDPPRVSSEGSFCLLLPLFLPVLSAHYFLVSLSLPGDCCFVPLQRPFLCDSKCGTARARSPMSSNNRSGGREPSPAVTYGTRDTHVSSSLSGD